MAIFYDPNQILLEFLFKRPVDDFYSCPQFVFNTDYGCLPLIINAFPSKISNISHFVIVL